MDQEPVPGQPTVTAGPADGRKRASLRQAIDFMLGFDYGEFAAWYRRGSGVSTAPTARSDVAAVTAMDDIARDRTIALVGLMGAGKSCIGRRLAARLDLPFIDADREIEEAAGCAISEIFARHGEQAFRDGERRVILRLLDGPPHVLATGGGAFMDPRTRQAIRDRAVSVWLRADLDLLLRRVARRNDRPLLQVADQRQKLQELMAQRDPVYATADISVDSADGPPEATLERVLTALAQRQPPEARLPLAVGGERALS
jgi:shikimate kinase